MFLHFLVAWGISMYLQNALDAQLPNPAPKSMYMPDSQTPPKQSKNTPSYFIVLTSSPLGPLWIFENLPVWAGVLTLPSLVEERA
jgi:hypothetical protein